MQSACARPVRLTERISFVFFCVISARLGQFYASARLELNEEIRKETQKYFRHSSKNAGQALPNKDAAIPDTVDNLYAEVDALAAEKSALSQRLVRTLERAMARLNHDIQRILKLQGDDPGLPATQHFLSSVDSTVQQIQTNLRTAAAAVEPPSASISAAAPPPQKSKSLTPSCSFRVRPALLVPSLPLSPLSRML